jgi:hypothetical protein
MATVTDLDRRIAERALLARQQSDAAPQDRHDESVTPHKPRPTQEPSGRRGDRWATYNAFVDVIAPRLTLAERAVWHVMFRHARNGVVETSVRMLAGGAAVSRSTAELAMGRLHRAGLIWPIWKSTVKSKASKYGMHPSPAACLPKLMDGQEPSRPSGRLAT